MLVENTTAAALPTSFRVVPRKPELTETTPTSSERPGVNDINTPAKQVKTLTATRWIRSFSSWPGCSWRRRCS